MHLIRSTRTRVSLVVMRHPVAFVDGSGVSWQYVSKDGGLH
jgi:hypothetical protein